MQCSLLLFLSLVSLCLGLKWDAANPPKRSVSFWYWPTTGDMEGVLNLLQQQSEVVTSVMIYCGHNISPSGKLVVDPTYAPFCHLQGGGLISRVKAMGIGVEFVVEDHGNITTDLLFMSDPTNIDALVTIANYYDLYGWNLDFEPSAPLSTAQAYAKFCTKLRAPLNQRGTRLTIDVANWSGLFKDFTLLAPTVDRLMDMETYNSDSFEGWIYGDDWGGYYNTFVNPSVPRNKTGVGLGCWPFKCGDHLCWTTTEESGQPRIDRIMADNVPEVCFWHLYGTHSHGSDSGPQDWWWPLLEVYSRS